MTRSRQRAARRDNSRRPRRPSIPEPVWTLRRGTGLLSLDVFGAALDRLVLVPADIHGLVAGELAGSGTPLPASYPDIRLAAERQAWRRARRSGRAFIGLADIADELVALLPSDGSDPRGLGRLAIAREVALERRLSRPNPEAVAAVAEARRQGVPVAFVADTYLPRDLVAALLRSAGLPAELVLVSSHEGATKDGGDLFRHLADRAGVRLDRIVHLGPDPAIDVGGPARMGIDARRLVPAGPAGRRRSPGRRPHRRPRSATGWPARCRSVSPPGWGPRSTTSSPTSCCSPMPLPTAHRPWCRS